MNSITISDKVWLYLFETNFTYSNYKFFWGSSSGDIFVFKLQFFNAIYVKQMYICYLNLT